MGLGIVTGHRELDSRLVRPRGRTAGPLLPHPCAHGLPFDTEVGEEWLHPTLGPVPGGRLTSAEKSQSAAFLASTPSR